MTELYGIKNCDTMKKARHWLDEHGVVYDFHDYKREGIDLQRLQQWEDQVGWEVLLNRRGMMWRKLDEQTRQTINRDNALKLMLETPSIIKRPVLVTGDGKVHVGFREADYAELF